MDSLAPAAATARQAITSSNESLQDALDALAVGGRTFDDIPGFLVDGTTADELAKKHTGLRDKIARSDETISHHAEDVSVKTAQIAKLEANIGVRSDEDARQAREQRDILWRDHRATLSAETADEFKFSMMQVDDIDGARLAHAKELGELRQLEQALVEAEIRLAAAQESLVVFKTQAKMIENHVTELATRVGLPSPSPARFLDWVERQSLAAAAKRIQEKATQQYREILHQAKQLHDALLPLLPLEAPSFDSALASARRLAEEERGHA